MNSSKNVITDVLLSIYKDQASVYRLKDIAMLVNETDFDSLNSKLNYYVRSGRLLNPRKGIYAKPGFAPEEVACKLYTPSYISLQYVLQRSGIIFQYDSAVTSVSYLSRTVDFGGHTLVYRKLKGSVLVNTRGILREKGVNIATAERAFIDLCYLESDLYFDNLHPLNREKLIELLPVYQNAALTKRITKLLFND
ncbi:MAG: hypothetical protein MUE37_06505 [Bacteroidales bacterium]|jgi:hypothetical protein|nr:hypothetical protein [Bacteroidales bacterium]